MLDLIIALTAADDFWTSLTTGSGAWLYLILILAIMFLVSLKWRYFAIFGMIVSAFYIINTITYANAHTWALETVYRIVLFGVAIFLFSMLMAKRIET